MIDNVEIKEQARIHLICMGCKHREIRLSDGVLCRLTGDSPSFTEECWNFSFSNRTRRCKKNKEIEKGWLNKVIDTYILKG